MTTNSFTGNALLDRLRRSMGRSTARSRAAVPGGWIAAGVALALLAIVLANALGWRLRADTQYRLDVGGWGDQDQLSGIWAQEDDGAGTTYRWTNGDSTFLVRDFAVAHTPSLTLDIGGLPPGAGNSRLVHTSLDGLDLALPVSAAARTYRLILPRGALGDGDLDLRMRSDASTIASDPRTLAFRLDDLSLGWPSSRWALPTPAMILAQLAIVVVWGLIAWRLGLPRWASLPIGVIAIGLMAWSSAAVPIVAMAWQMRVLAHSALLLALVWSAFPLIERYAPALGSRRVVQIVLLISVVAIAARIVVLLFPPWGSHDLYIHRDRLIHVQSGRLQLFDRPSEFGGQQTTVPPAFYMLVQPLTLLTRDPGVALQGLYAFLEGTSALLIAIVARQIGASVRAAIVAAIVTAALPIQITILWWGFGPQIFSQWLLLVLLVLITRPPVQRRAFWIAATMILTVAFLAHNGAVVLGGFALALYIALVWVFNAGQRAQARRWALVLIASSVIALALLYGDQVIAQLTSARSTSGLIDPTDSFSLRAGRIWHGLGSSFRPIGYVLTAISLVALIARTRGTQRWLIVGWLASAAAFLAVDIFFGLQVRYAYFMIPLLCVGVGIVVDWVMRWRYVGQALGTALLAWVCVTGATILVSGVFAQIKPTLTALTH